jgi:hypothetical protein
MYFQCQNDGDAQLRDSASCVRIYQTLLQPQSVDGLHYRSDAQSVFEGSENNMDSVLIS